MKTDIFCTNISEPDGCCSSLFSSERTHKKSILLEYWKTITTLLFAFMLVGQVELYSQTLTKADVEGTIGSWPQVLNNTANVKKAFQHDPFDVIGIDNQWTGGSQDPDASPKSNWHWAIGNSNDKGDIANAGAVMIGNVLFFFGDRTAVNGDAQIGFWFFLDDVGPQATPADGFRGEHTNGDMLVISNFTNGGGHAKPLVYIWQGKTATNPGTLVLNTTVDADLATNTGTLAIPSSPITMYNGQIWEFKAKGKNALANSYPVPLFFEGYIDLGKIANVNLCFQAFLLETRNSQSLTASLQDFVAGGFSGVPPPPKPAANPICYGDKATLTATDCAGTLKWYSADGKTLLQTGGSYTTPALTADTSYSVSCTVDGCEGPKASVTVKVNPLPIVSDAKDTFCNEDQSKTVLSDYDSKVGPGSGYTVAWFSDPARTNSISETGDLADGDHTYYATVTNNTTKCKANAQLVITINATPKVSNATDKFCNEDQSKTVLSDYDSKVGPGSGYTVAWFSDPARTNSISETGDLADGDHTYYATVTNNDTKCKANAQLVITINATPKVSNASDKFCNEDQSKTVLSDYDSKVGPGSGYTVAWFTDPARTNSISETGDLADGDHTYYATVTNNDTKCKANAQLVITINATPVVKDAKDAFCVDKQTNTTLSDYDSKVGPGSGFTVAWFSDPAHTPPSITETGDLAEGGYTYYATVTNNTTKCKANAQLVITINPLPVIFPPADKLADVDCKVSAAVAQTNANAAFKTWFDTEFKNSNPNLVLVPKVTYVYDPVEAKQANDPSPVIPVIGTPTLANPTAVTVTWTVTDGNGCVNSTSAKYSLNYNCVIACNITEITNSKCNGDNSGSFKVTAQGGTPPYVIYLYNKSDLTTPIANSGTLSTEPGVYTFKGLGKGDYLTESTDAVVKQGDGIPCEASIGEPDPVTLVISSKNVTCNEKANGKLSIDSYSGTGTAVISLSKDGGAFTEMSETDLESASYGPGKYDIKVCYPDGNGVAKACCLTKSTTITEPDVLTLDLTPTNANCFGVNGTISAAVTGTPLTDLEINIDGGSFATVTASPVTFNGVTAGKHTIVLRRISDNDCKVTKEVTVGSDNCSHIFPTQTTCCNYVTGTVTGLYNVCTTISGSTVTNAVPGVFFYYSFVTAPSANFTIEVKQTRDGDLNKPFLIQGYSSNTGQIRLTTENCGSISFTPSFIESGTGAKMLVTGATPGAKYVVSIKYDVKSLLGAVYSGIDKKSTYTFASYVNSSLDSGSVGTIDALAGCSDNTPLPGDCSLVAKIASTEPLAENKTAAADFTASPIPFKDQLTIRYNFDYVSDVTIEVFNSNGGLVLSKIDTDSYLNKEVLLNIDSGIDTEQVYIVKLTTNRGSTVKKVMSSR